MQDQRAAEGAEGRAGERGDEHGEHWIVAHAQREDPRGVRAQSKERRVPEGDDARAPQHEVHREREQDHDQRVGAERQLVVRQHEHGHCQQPGQGLSKQCLPAGDLMPAPHADDWAARRAGATKAAPTRARTRGTRPGSSPALLSLHLDPLGLR